LANPYISDFYDDMGRWSFHLQLWFLGSRIQQTLTMLADEADNVVQDRTIYEDAHIFADNLHSMGLMASRDFDTYMKMFNIEQTLLPKPDVLIYLKASVPTLIAQIKMRGRDYEQNIDEEYLSRLNEKYNNWIENIYEGRVLVVDKDVDDFVADPSIIDRICASVEEMCTGKRQL
jgi:deoxyadenosine/deoxycytidine kinase